MLRYGSALIVAAMVAAAAPIPTAKPSRPPSATAGEQGGPVQKPTATDYDNGKSYERGTKEQPVIVETHPAPDSETKARQEADYQERKAADETARNIGIASIIVGALQTVALVITFLIIAYVAVRQLRAYIYPGKSVVSKFSFTEPIIISLDIRNSGQTPARDFECHGITFIAELPLSDDSKMQEPKEDPITGRHSKASVFPGEPNNVNFDSVDLLTPEAIVELAKPNPKAAIYFAGEARYRDIFGFRRKTQFCRYIDSDDLVKLIRVKQGVLMPTEPWTIRFVTTHILNRFT